MRPFELIIIVVLFFSLLIRFFRLEKAAWLNLLPLFNLLATAYHLVFEGWRWQMIPLYLMSLWLIPFSLRRITYVSTHAKPPRKGMSIIALFLLLVFGALPAVLPVPHFPQPPGPYPVGTQSFYWVDQNRLEVYSSDPGQVYASPPSQPRRVMVQVWYPAVPDTGEGVAPYLPDGNQDAVALSKSFHFPGFFLTHFSLAKTNALLNGKLATCFDQWPVLVFSHGWNGMRYQNTAQMEALASQGFIVFAPEHAYGAVISVYPDGSRTLNKPEALPSDVSDEDYQSAALILGDSWVGDLRFTLDQLELLQSGEIPSGFAQHLDLTRIGMFGHSTGGGAVLQTCLIDSRCQAVFGEDAWLVPYNRDLPVEGIQQPAFLMFSEGWHSSLNVPLVDSLWQASPAGTLRGKLVGASHYDFSDLPLFSPLAHLLGLKGAIAPRLEIPLLNDFLFAFFDSHLLHPQAALLQQTIVKYPQVILQVR